MKGIRPQDYAFTVEARSSKWDVYHFRKNKKWGTLAFRYHEGRWEIGLFKLGKLQRDEAARELDRAGTVIPCTSCGGKGSWHSGPMGEIWHVCGPCRGTGSVTV